MGESNTVVSAYTMYRHLQQYCSHPSICIFRGVGAVLRWYNHSCRGFPDNTVDEELGGAVFVHVRPRCSCRRCRISQKRVRVCIYELFTKRRNF